MKEIIIGLILILFISGCAEVKEEKTFVPEEKEEEVVVCGDPFVLIGEECCLDDDMNNICDKDETVVEIVVDEECSISKEMECIEYDIKSTSASMTLKNIIGKDIILESLSIGDDCHKTFTTKRKELQNKEEITITIVDCINGNVGSLFKKDISVRYTEKFSELSKLADGSIETLVKDGEFVDTDPKEECDMPNGVECVDFTATETKIQLQIKNVIGYDMEKMLIYLEGDVKASCSGADFLSEGQESIYTCTGEFPGGLVREDVIIEYEKDGEYFYKEGELRVDIE